MDARLYLHHLLYQRLIVVDLVLVVEPVEEFHHFLERVAEGDGAGDRHQFVENSKYLREGRLQATMKGGGNEGHTSISKHAGERERMAKSHPWRIGDGLDAGQDFAELRLEARDHSSFRRALRDFGQ
jgi:hypothetical protein